MLIVLWSLVLLAVIGTQIAAAGRTDGPRFGLNGFVIVRDTEAEARDTLREIIAKAHVEAVEGFGAAVKQAGFVKVEVLDRNEWYFALAQRELESMEGKLKPVIVERIAGVIRTSSTANRSKIFCFSLLQLLMPSNPAMKLAAIASSPWTSIAKSTPLSSMALRTASTSGLRSGVGACHSRLRLAPTALVRK